MDVSEAGRWVGEVSKWSENVARNLGPLAGLASSSPSAAAFLNGWPHEALGDVLSRCLNSRLAERMKEVEYLTERDGMGRMDEVFQQMCHITSRLRSRE